MRPACAGRRRRTARLAVATSTPTAIGSPVRPPTRGRSCARSATVAGRAGLERSAAHALTQGGRVVGLHPDLGARVRLDRGGPPTWSPCRWVDDDAAKLLRRAAECPTPPPIRSAPGSMPVSTSHSPPSSSSTKNTFTRAERRAGTRPSRPASASPPHRGSLPRSRVLPRYATGSGPTAHAWDCRFSGSPPIHPAGRRRAPCAENPSKTLSGVSAARRRSMDYNYSYEVEGGGAGRVARGLHPDHDRDLRGHGHRPVEDVRQGGSSRLGSDHPHLQLVGLGRADRPSRWWFWPWSRRCCSRGSRSSASSSPSSCSSCISWAPLNGQGVRQGRRHRHRPVAGASSSPRSWASATRSTSAPWPRRRRRVRRRSAACASGRWLRDSTSPPAPPAAPSRRPGRRACRSGHAAGHAGSPLRCPGDARTAACRDPRPSRAETSGDPGHRGATPDVAPETPDVRTAPPASSTSTAAAADLAGHTSTDPTAGLRRSPGPSRTEPAQGAPGPSTCAGVDDATFPAMVAGTDSLIRPNDSASAPAEPCKEGSTMRLPGPPRWRGAPRGGRG